MAKYIHDDCTEYTVIYQEFKSELVRVHMYVRYLD